ncbi:hypothetical protein [Lysobacter sp. M15]|uniref:hypothetical protein n=1 Tax=Lysobacter sp. M15 TaxID=2916837 RepID=UPI001F5A3933|nr:hypothetical protein [Lysobacter sp. M15]
MFSDPFFGTFFGKVEVQPHQLEVIDLFTGILYTGREPRAETLRTLEEMARLIEGQWETI